MRILLQATTIDTVASSSGYPEVNTAGSYLYEPAGAIHRLHVLEENKDVTDVFFVVRGANLDFDEAGNVENILDAGAVLALYLAQCEEE